MANQNDKQTEKDKLPVVKSEDVAFSLKVADEDDLEALARAEAADRRQENR